ncbi:MAG: hypothetical protein LH615_05840 [Ferruginibacter sp.]|nr:hypothetical protein [Ferruginibacter sp.]
MAIFISLGYYFVWITGKKQFYFIELRFYYFIEYVLIAMFFYYLIEKLFVRKLILLSIIPFAIFCIYIYIESDPLKFNNYPPLVEFSFFIIVILYYFYEKISNVSRIPLYHSISFWLCVGLFIYFTGNFFYYLMVNSSKDPAFLKLTKIIYIIVSISKDIILGLAWFAHERVQNDSDILRIPDEMQLDDDFIVSKQNNV